MVGKRLPNGHVLLMMTPREAILLCDQILDPNQFPWQLENESMMVAMEAKSLLHGAVEKDAAESLGVISKEVFRIVGEKHLIEDEEPEA